MNMAKVSCSKIMLSIFDSLNETRTFVELGKRKNYMYLLFCDSFDVLLSLCCRTFLSNFPRTCRNFDQVQFTF